MPLLYKMLLVYIYCLIRNELFLFACLAWKIYLSDKTPGIGTIQAWPFLLVLSVAARQEMLPADASLCAVCLFSTAGLS